MQGRLKVGKEIDDLRRLQGGMKEGKLPPFKIKGLGV